MQNNLQYQIFNFDPLGNSNCSFHVEADNLHLLFLYDFFYFRMSTKEYIICLISFSKFSDILPAFTCPSAIGSL